MSRVRKTPRFEKSPRAIHRSNLPKSYDKREGNLVAALDWSQYPGVESIPGKVSGAWVLKGTRTPVKVVFENLEAGMTVDEVIEQFPVTREQIEGLMAFVARSLETVPAHG